MSENVTERPPVQSESWDPVQQERNRYVRFRTAFTFDRFIDLPRDHAHRILDFGCGYGHSVDALLDQFPCARVVCADSQAGPVAALSARFSGDPRVSVHVTESDADLDRLGEDFAVVHMNAVFEHLLPSERAHLMPRLWRKLRPGGFLVLTETPWRWFPIETHTTSLPLINYAPDWLALFGVRRCGRYSKDISWTESLKQGVRGATVREIIATLQQPAGSVQLIRSDRPDARDVLEVWWHGECRHSRQKAFAYSALKTLRTVTGLVMSPWVNVVLKKV